MDFNLYLKKSDRQVMFIPTRIFGRQLCSKKESNDFVISKKPTEIIDSVMIEFKFKQTSNFRKTCIHDLVSIYHTGFPGTVGFLKLPQYQC